MYRGVPRGCGGWLLLSIVTKYFLKEMLVPLKIFIPYTLHIHIYQT